MADQRRNILRGFLIGILLFLSIYHGSLADIEDREWDLLNTLKQSTNRLERQAALNSLYRYYNNKKIDYMALSYLQKLIDLYKEDKDYFELESAYLSLGDIYRNRQEFMKALNYYFEALVCSEKLGAETPRSGYIYLHISRLFRLMNRNELAWKYLKKAFDYTVKYRDEDLKVSVMLEYSRWYYEEGDYEDALAYIDLSLKSEKRLNKYICTLQGLHHKALILIKMADSRQGGNNASRAMDLLKQAVDMGLRFKKYENLLPVMKDYIENLVERHRLAEAAAYLDYIDDIYAPYYPYYYIYYYLQALIYEKQGEMDKAQDFYVETARELDTFFSKLHIHQYHTFAITTATIYSHIIEFHLAMYGRTGERNHLVQALFFSEIKNAYIYQWNSLKTGRFALLQEEKKKLEAEFFRYNQQYLRLLKNNSRHINNTNGVSDSLRGYERKLEELKKQIRELEEIVLESPISYKRYRFDDFDITAIQQRLSDHQRIIKYTVLENNCYAFVIGKDSFNFRRLELNTAELVEYINRLTEPLDDFTQGKVDYLRVNFNLQLAHQLYNVLLADLAGLLKQTGPGAVDELFVIPDQQLFKLPFEALVTGFNEKDLDPNIIFSEYAAADYVIHRYPVTYMLSLFHFRELHTSGGKPRYTIAAFGDPDVSGSEGLRDRMFQPLPASRKEVKQIQAIFGNRAARIFLGKRFTRKRFEYFARHTRILHIATHFINNLEFPQYSALLFSANGKGSPLYYAHDIFKLKLNSELVVLSSCESSEKNLLGLQGLRGMTASFRHAGVRSMMVSMWPVDEHSSELTPLFYQEYVSFLSREQEETGNSRLVSSALALQAAKQQLMNQTAEYGDGVKISFAHPFIWANYILYTFNY